MDLLARLLELRVSTQITAEIQPDLVGLPTVSLLTRSKFDGTN